MVDLILKHLDTVLLLFLVGNEILRKISTRTKTTIDDKIVSAIDWVRKNAWNIFNIVEDLNEVGLIKTDKLSVYRQKLNEAHQKVYGRKLPEAAIAEAENIAAGLAAADHNLKRVNPQPAPEPEK